MLRDCYRIESERFVLHSDPWINLHHFLFEWARNVPERRPKDHRRAVEVTEHVKFPDLDDGERKAWERALSLYREQLVDKELVSNEELVELRDALATIVCTGDGAEVIESDVWAALLAAMPVYRRYWWTRHHAYNLDWLETVQAALREHESILAERVAESYGGRWPVERVRVDVTAYANWAGNYTTNYPDHITVSSATETHVTGPEALETLFHEVSHGAFFEEPLLAELEAAFQVQGIEAPDQFSHVLQFFTPAELLRLRLSDEELASFQPYAERSGLYERSRIRNEYRHLLESHWAPYLAGQITRSQALERVVAELAPQRATTMR